MRLQFRVSRQHYALVKNAIAPQCIDDDLKFSFGDDTPLYISTQVNGCDVAMAIAPRIEAGEEP